MLDADSHNLKRNEAMKLMYAMQIAAANQIYAIDKQRARASGQHSQYDKYDSQTKVALNLIDWQE